MYYCKSNKYRYCRILWKNFETVINIFSKQSLNIELCKVPKREEKEEVYSCNIKKFSKIIILVKFYVK